MFQPTMAERKEDTDDPIKAAFCGVAHGGRHFGWTFVCDFHRRCSCLVDTKTKQKTSSPILIVLCMLPLLSSLFICGRNSEENAC